MTTTQANQLQSIYNKINEISGATKLVPVKRIEVGAFNASGVYDITSLYSDYKSISVENFAVVVTSSGCWHDNSSSSGGSQTYNYAYNNASGVLTISYVDGANTHAHQSTYGTIYLFVPDPDA